MSNMMREREREKKENTELNRRISGDKSDLRAREPRTMTLSLLAQSCPFINIRP